MSSDSDRNGTPTLAIRLLGPPMVTVEGHPLEVDTRKAVALLAYLAAEKPVISRQVALGFLWPELDEGSARAALRRTLSVLRKGVGEAVTADRDTIEIDQSVILLDVARFVELAASTGAHRHGRAEACPLCVPILEEAVGMFRGDFMEGFSLRACPPFELWQLNWAERLRLQLDETLERLALACAMAEDFWRAIGHTRRRLELNPLTEQAWCQLMRLHAWIGNRSAALDTYRECVATLDRELGVPPLETTTELMEAIADNDLQPAPGTRKRATIPPSDRAKAIASEQVLESAAVLGEAFTVDLLRVVSGRSESETVIALDELLVSGDLVESSGTLDFPDVSSRDRVYSEMLLSRRRLLHGRAADALLGRAGVSDATAVASHLENAGRLVDAAKHRVVVAEAATATHQFDRAIANYDAALALGHQAPESIHEAVGDIHRSVGRYGEALAAYERAAGRQPASRVDAKIGSLFARIGGTELATHHLRSALEDPELVDRGRVLVDLGMVEARAGRLSDAQTHAVAARQYDAADLSVLAHTENLLGVITLKGGRNSSALRHLEQACHLAERIGDETLVAAAANNRGLALAALGDFESAIDAARQAVAACVDSGDRHAEAASRNNLADHLRRAGQRDESIEEVTRGVAMMAEIGVEKDKLEPEIWKLTEW